MDIELFFGPDKTSFEISSHGRAMALDGSIPFHGIIGRGLLKECSRLRWQLPWNELSHKLHCPVLKAEDSRLYRLQKLGKKCGVLSFEESTAIARTYTLQFVMNNKDVPDAIELWNIKEGHTSSVWKVTIRYNQGKKSFALNVSRDQAAAKELLESSRAMIKIQDAYPNIKMARVQDISNISMEHFGNEIKVLVVRNDWIEDAYEIHERSNRNTLKQELLLVERFIQRPEIPAHIVSIVGRVFSESEVAIIKKGIKEFMRLATKALLREVKITINDGDVVWNGKKAVIVAISN